MNHQKQIWVVAGLVSYLSTGSHSPVKLDAPPAESVLSPYFHNLEMYTHTHIRTFTVKRFLNRLI